MCPIKGETYFADEQWLQDIENDDIFFGPVTKFKSRATELICGNDYCAMIPLPKTLSCDNDKICWQLVGLKTNKYTKSEF